MISILRDDGHFIARSRNLEVAQNVRLPDDRPFMHSHPGEHGIFRNVSVIEKIPMLFSWSHLAAWPVIAVTAIDENSELTGVINKQSDSRMRTLLAIALFISFSIWVSALFSRISRKNHELSLNEIRFRNLLENAPNAMVTIDPVSGRLVQANQIALKMWGYGTEEFLTKTKDDITYSDDLAESRIRNAQLAKGVLDTARFEKRYLKKDGSYFWGETCVSTLKDATGKVNLFISSTIDITERKKTEQALNRESAKNLALLLNASDGIHILDIEGNVIEASNSFCMMLGYQHDEVIGMNVRQWDAQFSDTELSQVICEQFSRQTQFQFETTHRRKDGSIFNVEISGIPILLDGKAVTFYSSRDITERKRTERMLSELSAHLQIVREEEKSKFAREIHDELSGTLAALKMDASWLASKMPATTAMIPLQNCAKSMGNLIENAAVAMRRIITDLRPPMLNELGLIETFRWQCADFQKRTGIKCKITCIDSKDQNCNDCKNCESNFDGMLSIHLYRIFQETLTNVARHSGATRVEAEFEVGKNDVRLTVKDNGCGLPEGHNIAPTSFGILGMHERVGQLHGKIEFDTFPGKGLTVSVILPLSAPTLIKTEEWQQK
jgi:PAS domain S-box-containing protein